MTQLLPFKGGAVAAYFYDLCMSQLDFKHPTFRLLGEHFNQLRNPRDSIKMIKYLRGLYVIALHGTSNAF